MNSKIENLLKIWERDLRIICHSHYDAAVSAKRKNYSLGIPVIIISTIVGSTIFLGLNFETNQIVQLSIGLLSLFGAVLASLQTFLKWSERSKQHREAGARFGGLYKELEEVIHVSFNKEKDFRKWSEDFRKRWDTISLESPTIPQNTLKKRIEIVNKELKSASNGV